MAGGLSFSVKNKLTPFQKHKKEEEVRKKREDAESAKLYEEFAASFGSSEAEPGSSSFVRGGTIQPGSRPSAAPAAAPASSRYVPKFMPPGMVSALSGGVVVKQEEARPRFATGAATVTPRTGGSDRKPPRKIDMMLQTLKREQEERESRQQELRDLGLPANADDMDPGALSEVDPHTTNLYVGNLSPDIDEALLKKEFGRFGPIASVKIMWPRDDDQRRRGRNSGFVAFMTRPHAEAARDEMNNAVLHDNELKVGWGKSVAIPAAPIYVSSSFAGSSAQVAQRGAAVPPPGVEAPPPWTDPHAAEGRGQGKHVGVGPDIPVLEPADGRQRYIIDMLASYVAKDGCALEQVIMEREASNPEFAFMYNLASPEHVYYRWRLYSLAQGDTLRTWREEPFVLLAHGPLWLPPPMPTAAITQKTAAQRGGEGKDKDRPLSELQRDRFEDLLRGLTAERKDVRGAMVFALDNAESAAEVVEILTEALTIPETPIPTKVARLFLASDILHNSTASVRNASRYRNRLEDTIPDIFQSFHDTYKCAESRMQQEALRRHVLRVLRIWRDWFIFADDFLNGLQATFLGGGSGSPLENAELQAEIEALDDEALELRCSRSGLSRQGGRTAQMARLQALHAYLSGDRESAVPHPAGGTLVAEADSTAASAWILGGTAAPSDGTAGDDASVRPVLSKWESADAPDISFDIEGPSPRALAVPAPASASAPKPKPAEPVSRWTEVEDTDDDADEPIAARIAASTAAAAAAAAASAAAASSPAHSDRSEDHIPGLGGEPGDSGIPPPLPGMEWAAADEDGPPPPLPAEIDPSSVAKAARSAKEDEERRLRLRQVEVAAMVFREDLEGGTLGRAAIDAKVAEYRAKLVAEAEVEAASAAAAAAEKKSAAERKLPAENKSSIPRPSRDSSRSDREREKSRTERDRDAERRESGREGGHSGRRDQEEPRRRYDSPDTSRRRDSRSDRDERKPDRVESRRREGSLDASREARPDRDERARDREEPRRRVSSPDDSHRRERDERQRERQREDSRERDLERERALERKRPRTRSGSPSRPSSRSPGRNRGKRSAPRQSKSRSPVRRSRDGYDAKRR